MEQLQQESVKGTSIVGVDTKTPLPVIIIAILILVDAVGTIWTGSIEALFPGISNSFPSGIWMLIYGIVLIFVALDIRRMRRWALYVYTIAVIGETSYLLLTGNNIDAYDIYAMIFDVAIIAYLWIIFKRFNSGHWMEVFHIPKFKLIVVCVSFVAVLLLIFFGGHFMNTILCMFINCGTS
ncbi:MAG: hypothetical protein Q7K40_05485 [bacterium]|nr:hypothetical protein [bacterium]